MSKNWIIDVLGDLRGFAKTNDMPSLAVSLEEAMIVALAEIPEASTAYERKEADAEDGRRTGTFG